MADDLVNHDLFVVVDAACGFILCGGPKADWCENYNGGDKGAKPTEME